MEYTHIRIFTTHTSVVDRPTQLICISDIYLSTDKYKRHSNLLTLNWDWPSLAPALWRPFSPPISYPTDPLFRCTDF